MTQALRFIISIGALAALLPASGCAVNITTENFLHQQDTVEALKPAEMRDALDEELTAYTLETASITTPDGVRLEGVSFMQEGAIANLVFFGGNGMTIASSHTILKRFAQIPVNVTWFDYRGSGASEKDGALAIDQLKSDAVVVLESVRATSGDELPLVIHGMSMGSLVASHVATQRDIDGLVLDSAITTVPALVENMTPFFASATVQPELAKINNMELLENYRGPLMLIVGDEDDITPVEFSQTLLDTAASEQKKLVVIPGREHAYGIKSDMAIGEYRAFIESL